MTATTADSTPPFQSSSAASSPKVTMTGSSGSSLQKAKAPSPARVAADRTLATGGPVASSSRITLESPAPSTSKAASSSRTTLGVAPSTSKAPPTSKAGSSGKVQGNTSASTAKLPGIDTIPAGVSPSLSSPKTMGFDEATAEHYYAELIKRSRGEFPLGELRNRYRAPTFKNSRVAAGLAATDDLKELVAGQLRSAEASSSSKKLLDMPVLCGPFELRLLFWLAPIPVQPTVCVDPLLLGQLYREMLAHLQLVIITMMQGVTTNNWVDMMKPYLGKAPFTPLCRLLKSTAASIQARAFYRIDPRGTFDRNSLKRYCVGCTRIAVKIGHAQLRPLLARIATEASSETDADGFLCAPLPDPPTTLHGDDVDALMVFAARKFTTCQSAHPNRHTQGGTARVPDLYKAAAACYLGGKRFRDPTSLDLPLSVGEIDRLKPDSKYNAAHPNDRVFRVFFSANSGFNDIRMDAIDKTPVVVYVNGVKANAHLWLEEKELRLAK